MQALQSLNQAGNSFHTGTYPWTCLWFDALRRFTSTEWKAEEIAEQQAFTSALRVKQRGNCFYIGMFCHPLLMWNLFICAKSFRSQIHGTHFETFLHDGTFNYLSDTGMALVLKNRKKELFFFPLLFAHSSFFFFSDWNLLFLALSICHTLIFNQPPPHQKTAGLIR